MRGMRVVFKFSEPVELKGVELVFEDEGELMRFLRWLKGPRGRHGKRWTAEEVRKLRDMRREGRSWKEIAAALGRSEGAVRVKYCKMKGR